MIGYHGDRGNILLLIMACMARVGHTLLVFALKLDTDIVTGGSAMLVKLTIEEDSSHVGEASYG